MADDLELQIVGREGVADWLETSLLVRGTRQLGRDEALRLAREEAKCGEPLANLGIQAMRRRKDLLGEAYPFDVVGDLAVRARSDAAVFPYSTLLLLTSGSVARQTVIAESTTAMEVLLEALTETALGNLWGPGSRALRFGYPSEHGRPQAFAEAIDWLAREMGIDAGAGYRPPRRKDGGVDVVAWRPFPDGRSGFPVVLAQATLQAELFSKSGDVDVRIWSAWLSLDFEPLTALAFPGYIANAADWTQIALRSMILDRFRLAHLIGADQSVGGSWALEVVEELRPLLMIGQA